jgi:hypothetical protein
MTQHLIILDLTTLIIFQIVKFLTHFAISSALLISLLGQNIHLSSVFRNLSLS